MPSRASALHPCQSSANPCCGKLSNAILCVTEPHPLLPGRCSRRLGSAWLILERVSPEAIIDRSVDQIDRFTITDPPGPPRGRSMMRQARRADGAQRFKILSKNYNRLVTIRKSCTCPIPGFSQIIQGINMRHRCSQSFFTASRRDRHRPRPKLPT